MKKRPRSRQFKEKNEKKKEVEERNKDVILRPIEPEFKLGVPPFDVSKYIWIPNFDLIKSFLIYWKYIQC